MPVALFAAAVYAVVVGALRVQTRRNRRKAKAREVPPAVVRLWASERVANQITEGEGG